MTKREILKAVEQIRDCAGDKTADKLILAVPLKKNKAEYRKDAIEAIARGDMEKPAEVRKMLKGYVPAVYVRASGLEYGLTEGDLCMLRVEGRHADSYHSGEVVYFHPSTDLRLADAYVVDENMEHSRDLDGAVNKLCSEGY